MLMIFNLLEFLFPQFEGSIFFISKIKFRATAEQIIHSTGNCKWNQLYIPDQHSNINTSKTIFMSEYEIINYFLLFTLIIKLQTTPNYVGYEFGVSWRKTEQNSVEQNRTFHRRRLLFFSGGARILFSVWVKFVEGFFGKEEENFPWIESYL